MTTWRFLNSGRSDGATNMAVDEAILAGVVAGASPPTVRVYAWEPPTVSIGRSQKPGDELDLEACSARGFGVVRRPTGGRAVLHAGELTYSVVGPAGEPPLGISIAETYESIAEGLLEALSRLGVQARLATVATASRARGEAAPPCFASAGRFEVVVGGRKLIGSAQRRSGASVLQHGSLLMDGTHAGLADVMKVGDPHEREVVRGMLASKTTDLSSILARPVEFDEIAAAMKVGFERAWGVELVPAGLSDGESKAVPGLATGYRTEG
jgi:lipoate-protein ligase A